METGAHRGDEPAALLDREPERGRIDGVRPFAMTILGNPAHQPATGNQSGEVESYAQRN
jgi:hypothetical protein